MGILLPDLEVFNERILSHTYTHCCKIFRPSTFAKTKGNKNMNNELQKTKFCVLFSPISEESRLRIQRKVFTKNTIPDQVGFKNLFLIDNDYDLTGHRSKTN